MYQIPIDDLNYHANLFSEQEIEWIDAVCSETLKKYPDLREYFQSTLSPLHLTADGAKRFMRKVLLAFCHTIQRDFPVNTREQLCKTLKKWLLLFLPVIVSNDQVFRASHCVQYEPQVLASLAFSNFLNGESIQSKFSALESGTFENYYIWECINFARAVRSSMLLFAVGDDVHGVCNYRGSIEILSKIVLAERFQDEYVLFKNFNVHLQHKKLNNTPLPDEMTEYLEKCPEYKTNPENFLAYGWARDPKGNRITKMTSFIRNAIPDNKDLFLWIHLSSEFVHEDYVAVDYDYPLIRKELLHVYFIMYGMILDDVKSLFTKDERKQNGFSDIASLFSLVSQMYPA